MTTHHRQLVLTAAVAAAVLCGCSSPPDDPAPPDRPAASGTGPWPTPSDAAPAEPLPSASVRPPRGGIPVPGDVDQDDAGAVAHGALTALHTYDTTRDTSRHQAALRTADAGWCTRTYAAQLRKAAPRSAPGATWTTWADHQAVVRPRLTPADEAGKPADTDRLAYRQWIVTLTPRGADDWKGPEEDLLVAATLTRTSPAAPWRLDALAVQ
ncbi:hypothetical protein G3I57_16195 [Streptomyces albidoflavus]|uniref:hypothetical protein n=1 Tax=Streptomyces albidoflavus TaxID=1886 RepID=UPI0013DA187A|nr:hypothetical protein [Streptomyces albidoflavus]